jgi:hypothetical protein
MADTTVPVHEAEREFETGKDEAWFGNIKRTYDEFQQESLETLRRSRDRFDSLQSQQQTHVANVNAVALQALQNAVETANIMGKQSVQQTLRHNDLAMDRQWNVDEQGYTSREILNESTFRDAIRSIVVDALKEKPAA